MHIVLEEELFKADVMELKRRRYSNYLFVQIGNKRGFIVSQNPNLIEKISNNTGFTALLAVDEKVPLYQQDMMMRMGRTPKGTKSVIRSYNVRILDKNTCYERHYYNVWKIIQY